MSATNQSIENSALGEGCRLRRTAGTTGIILTVLCGVHCAALPTLTTAMLLMGIPLRQQATLEVVLMVANLSLAMFLFLPSAVEGRNLFSFQAVLIALLFFILGWQLSIATELLRQSLTLSSSILLVLAHGQHLWTGRRGICHLPVALRTIVPRQ